MEKQLHGETATAQLTGTSLEIEGIKTRAIGFHPMETHTGSRDKPQV